MSITKKYFSIFLLIISNFLIIYVFYKSEIVWKGSKRDYYLIYYIISIILILFSIISFYISQKVIIYTKIVLLSVVFTLYSFETYLTFNSTKKMNTEKVDFSKNIKLYKDLTGKDYDTREMLKIYYDKKKENKDISVYVPWTKDIFEKINHSVNSKKNILGKDIYPLSAISNSQTIHCNENGYYSIYQSDRYGFNNPDSQWDKERIEYLLVGDSFAHGACVNRPNDIASVLRTLSNKDALNLGQAHTGPLKMYAMMREFLKPNVKNILWVSYEGNDYEDLYLELKSKILKNYLNNLNFTQNLKMKQNLVDQVAREQIKLAERFIKPESQKFEILDNNQELDPNNKNSTTLPTTAMGFKLNNTEKNSFESSLLKFIKIFKTRYLISNYHQNPYPEYSKILKLAKELAQKNKSNFYYVHIPEQGRFISNSLSNESYDKIKKIVEELDIKFIDIYKDVLLKETNPLRLYPFETKHHFTVEGYKKIAEYIYNFTSD